MGYSNSIWKTCFKYDKLITFYDNASSGTIALADIYYKVVANSRLASFIYIDEFDAFYHYEIAEKLVNYFKEIYPKCQIIITSHNTKLISNRLMRPDCLFILSREGKLTSLCDATTRELREGHNLKKCILLESLTNTNRMSEYWDKACKLYNCNLKVVRL